MYTSPSRRFASRICRTLNGTGQVQRLANTTDAETQPRFEEAQAQASSVSGSTATRSDGAGVARAWARCSRDSVVGAAQAAKRGARQAHQCAVVGDVSVHWQHVLHNRKCVLGHAGSEDVIRLRPDGRGSKTCSGQRPHSCVMACKQSSRPDRIQRLGTAEVRGCQATARTWSC